MSQIIKPVDAIKAGDIVVPFNGEKMLLEVLHGVVEYDYGDPFAVWLTVKKYGTEEELPKPINAAEVSWPLNPMEVLAWAAK